MYVDDMSLFILCGISKISPEFSCIWRGFDYEAPIDYYGMHEHSDWIVDTRFL